MDKSWWQSSYLLFALCGFRECRHFSRNSSVKKLGIKVETRVTRTLALWQFSLSSAKKSWHLKLRSVRKWMRMRKKTLEIPKMLHPWEYWVYYWFPVRRVPGGSMQLCRRHKHAYMFTSRHMHTCMHMHTQCWQWMLCTYCVSSYISPYTVTQVCNERLGPSPLSW